MTDSTISWVHLSDFHADPSRLPFDDDKLIRGLPDYLRSLRERRGRGFDFLLFTGDLVRGAAMDELARAATARERESIVRAKQADLDKQYRYAIGQINRVREGAGVPKSMCFFVPGNHDAAWTDVTPPLDELVSRCLMSPASERHRLAKLEAMQPVLHRRWLESLRGAGYLRTQRTATTEARTRAKVSARVGGHYLVQFELDGVDRPFELFVLNSAWLCAHSMRGEYQLPAGAYLQVKDLLFQFDPPGEEGADRPDGAGQAAGGAGGAKTPARMIAIHHPPEWLLHDDAQRLLSAFRSEFHVLAHGHLHQAVVDAATSGHVRVGCGALYQGSEREHAFIACDLDLATGLLCTEIHEYSRYSADQRHQAGGWRLREGDDGLPESGRNRAVLRFNREADVARGGIEHFERHTQHRGVVLAVDICGFSSLEPDTQAAAIKLLWSTANRTIADAQLTEAAVVSSMGDGIQLALDEESVPRLPARALGLLAVLFDAFRQSIENAGAQANIRPVRLRAGAAFGSFVVLREVASTKRASRHILAGNACNQARRLAFLGRANFTHVCRSLSKRVAAEESEGDSPSLDLLGLRITEVRIYSPEFGASETEAYLYGHAADDSAFPRPYSDEHRRLAEAFAQRLPRVLQDVLASLAGKHWERHLCAELLYLEHRPAPGSVVSEFACALTTFGDPSLNHLHWSKLGKGHVDVVDSAMAGRSAVFQYIRPNAHVLIADVCRTVRQIPGYDVRPETWTEIQPVAAISIGPQHPNLVLTLAMRLADFGERAKPSRAIDLITKISLGDHLDELGTLGSSVV